jgi:hypothetical protein
MASVTGRKSFTCARSPIPPNNIVIETETMNRIPIAFSSNPDFLPYRRDPQPAPSFLGLTFADTLTTAFDIIYLHSKFNDKWAVLRKYERKHKDIARLAATKI